MTGLTGIHPVRVFFQCKNIFFFTLFISKGVQYSSLLHQAGGVPAGQSEFLKGIERNIIGIMANLQPFSYTIHARMSRR
jgi:hypothetical protein